MDQQSFIYQFLLAPRLRLWRYIALTVFFTIVSLNQTFVSYMELIPQMGHKVYWILAITILTYVVSVFLFSKIASKYLLRGKYLQFSLSVALCALIYMIIPNTAFYWYLDNYIFLSKIILIDNLGYFVLYIFCISGVIIPIFLKNWIISNQHLDQLKIRQASSQVEQFKEQINPPSFFKILNRSKQSVKTDPDKASSMLMKLAQLLRYQLYDCNREQVLLSAEISFLKNFLELEKLSSPGFDYTIETKGNINGIFVSPSVLLPYTQSVVNVLEDGDKQHNIAIQLEITNSIISIVIRINGISNNISLQKELLKVRERLNALYKDRYGLTISDHEIDGAVDLALLLKRI